MLAKNIYVLYGLSICLNVYTHARSVEATQTNNAQKQDNKEEYIKILEDAANNVAELYNDQKINNGSASALNQIAAAFYTLGEQYEKHANTNERKLSTQFYEKATIYFTKASLAGCKEATYNAGLTYSKLKKYDESSKFYRQCIQETTNSKQETNNDQPQTAGLKEKKSKTIDLALKAAGNLAVLMMNKNINSDINEIKDLLVLGKKYKDKKQAVVLLETAMVILTDLNTNAENSNKNENDNDNQSKMIELTLKS